MAKGRRSTVVMTSEVGESREAKIANLVAAGLTNEAIWAAMETTYPSTISADDPRRKVKGNKLPPFDAEERTRLGWAIRSVKGLMVKEDAELQGLLADVGDSEVKGIDKIPFTNRSRFQSGIFGIDHTYGKTFYKHTEDGKGYKKGDPMMIAGVQKVEFGLPRSFLSFWGGAAGVGKTRLAIALTKALNALGKQVCYYNGEVDESDFRSWVGPNVNGDLFKVFSSEIVRTETIVHNAFTLRSPVIIVDSFQMLAEVMKGNRGAKTALSRFKILKSDEAAGCPHIIFISQLNKKEEMAGSQYLQHMVDGVIRVYKHTLSKDQFWFHSQKMRGAACPIMHRFRHTPDSVECLTVDGDDPKFNLKQITNTAINNPIITGGVTTPAIVPSSTGTVEAVVTD